MLSLRPRQSASCEVDGLRKTIVPLPITIGISETAIEKRSRRFREVSSKSKST